MLNSHRIGQVSDPQEIATEVHFHLGELESFVDRRAFGMSFRGADMRGRQDECPGHRLPGLIKWQNQA